MMDWDAFFALHERLPRQGPGTPEDVLWALSLVELKQRPLICDAGCGRGADALTLAAALPEARLIALDTHVPFIEPLNAALASHAQSRAEVASFADLATHSEAPFDFVWSAGALYFLGLETALSTMHAALRPGGVLAFSEPCFFTETPSADAIGFWDGHPTRSDTAILAAISAAGFEVLAHRPVSDAGWDAYYDPMADVAATLRKNASPAAVDTLNDCLAEGARWRAVKDETGYLLTVARKVS